MFSCNHGVHGQRRRAFSNTKLFFARSIESNISMGRIISEIGNDLESDPQNSLQEHVREILSEEKIKEGQTDPRKLQQTV